MSSPSPMTPTTRRNTSELALKPRPFQIAGVMQNGTVLTSKVEPDYRGEFKTLGDVVLPDSEVPEQFFIAPDKVPSWEYLKGAKKEKRINKASGFEYFYTEAQCLSLTRSTARRVPS